MAILNNLLSLVSLLIKYKKQSCNTRKACAAMPSCTYCPDTYDKTLQMVRNYQTPHSIFHEDICNKHINPIALRKAKIVYNLGLSECNRVKQWIQVTIMKYLQISTYFAFNSRNYESKTPCPLDIWLFHVCVTLIMPNSSC